MALYEYLEAMRRGKRQYQVSVSRGEYPYLPVLDDILEDAKIKAEVNLGVLEIPLDRVIGTKTEGRTQSFASNFMPILDEKSEFASKWSNVYDYQVEQGIQEPIVAYEYMNRYYVQEGNKRVSVYKFINAYSIMARVIRLIPKPADNHETRLYYEFLDFYEVSLNSDVCFTEEGSYNQLLQLMGKEPKEVWTQDERQYFRACYDRFIKIFREKRTSDVEMTSSDAFLMYVSIFGYDQIKERTANQMKRDLDKFWNEILLKARGSQIELMEQPDELENEPPLKLIDWLFPSSHIEVEQLKAAFIYPKDKNASDWVYSHELGRLHLEECFHGKLRTLVFDNANTEDEVMDAIDKAIAARCNIIFTISPGMAAQSVKAAVLHPQVRVFNCSVNLSYSSISTYYARMYESKFLLGALAAAMSESDKIGFISDYPIYGRVANINAFAMGAQMINPRVKVHLKWSGLAEHHCRKELEEEGITHISGDDIVTPGNRSREFGLYCKEADGSVDNLATSFCDWGKFYEKIIRLICDGALDRKNLRGKKAINYWWGMSADVIDVICSENLPYETKRLIRFLKSSIQSGAFRTFEGPIQTQDGRLIGKEGETLSPEEIIRMDWLVSNVVGEIPDMELFNKEAQPMMQLQGVKQDEEV